MSLQYAKSGGSSNSSVIIASLIVGACVIISVSILVFGSKETSQVQKVVTTSCGNSICDKGETCQTCSEDCICPSTMSCGNPGDQYANEMGCKPFCGNGACDGGENCQTCAQDCSCPEKTRCDVGAMGMSDIGCVLYCGNGQCDNGENMCSCPTDCDMCSGNPGTCKEFYCNGSVCATRLKSNCCGNGICETDENQCTCSKDCGECSRSVGTCLELACVGTECLQETVTNCCGNGICETNENCSACSVDCGNCSSPKPNPTKSNCTVTVSYGCGSYTDETFVWENEELDIKYNLGHGRLSYGLVFTCSGHDFAMSLGLEDSKLTISNQFGWQTPSPVGVGYKDTFSSGSKYGNVTASIRVDKIPPHSQCPGISFGVPV